MHENSHAYCLRHPTFPQCLTRETLSMLQQTQFLLGEQYPWSNCQLCIDNTTKIKIEVMCASHFWYMYNWYAKQEFSIHRSSLTRGFWSTPQKPLASEDAFYLENCRSSPYKRLNFLTAAHPPIRHFHHFNNLIFPLENQVTPKLEFIEIIANLQP